MFMWHLNIDFLDRIQMQFQKGLLMFIWQPHQCFLVTWNYWSTGATTNPRLSKKNMEEICLGSKPKCPSMGREYLCTSISPWKMWPFLFVTFFVGKESLEQNWRREPMVLKFQSLEALLWISLTSFGEVIKVITHQTCFSSRALKNWQPDYTSPSSHIYEKFTASEARLDVYHLQLSYDQSRKLLEVAFCMNLLQLPWS